ncbi:TPA: hypothetical protein ACIRVE_005091 [Pseudomonas putida]
MKRFSPKPWFVVASTVFSFVAVMAGFLGFLSPGKTVKALVVEPDFWYFTVALAALIVLVSEVARPFRNDELNG